MASVKPVGSVQESNGTVTGTFEFARGERRVTFQLNFPSNATQEEIGQSVVRKCIAIAAQEPRPALTVLEQMQAAGQSWAFTDPQPAA